MNLRLNAKTFFLFATALNFATNVHAHDPKVHFAPEGAVPIDNEWIVVLKPHTNGRRRSRKLTEETVEAYANSIKGVKVGGVLHASLEGFTAEMSVEAADQLAKIGEIDYIEQNMVVTADQATWGLDRVDQRDLPLNGEYTVEGDGSDVYAYIIDTGVQISHNEFKDANGVSRAEWGVNTSGDNEERDCNGHGTHVAGTVGGTTYGMAKNVKIVAVKVLQCSGSGSTAGVVQGVDWAKQDAQTNNRKATANLSLGGGFSTAMNTAVKNLHESGVPTVVAAGNSNRDACGYSPASEPSVLTVGSTTSTDARSGFSNFGSCVDIFAPGSGITAAWIGADTATRTISGTSMASPHVCGAAALLLGNGIDASTIDTELISRSTPDKVSNPGANSPNKLLYAGAIGPTQAPTPAPPTAAPTPCQDKSITVTLKTDNYPAETSWTIKNTCTGEENVLAGGPYNSSGTKIASECVPTGEYEFTINDAWGDGICCGYGNGSYEIEYDGAVVAEGGSFGSSETKTFGACQTSPTVPPTAAPTKAPTPTAAPTKAPTATPTKAPTPNPTKAPTAPPTLAPTTTPKPNLARSGTATQSSTCYGGVASRGNDGNTNGRYFSRSVTHTCRRSSGSWWKVDLEGENAIIEEIIIWNRTDCCSQRLTGSKVEILDRNGDVVAENEIPSASGVSKFNFSYENVEGVEVRISRPGNEFLSLAEVEVLGTITTLPPSPPTAPPTAAPTKTPKPSLIKSGTAIQSTTCHGGVASRGIDGNTDGSYWNRSVTHTCRRSSGSWWKVDLEGDNAIIDEIVIWNREDCCSQRLTGSIVEIIDRDGVVVESRTIPTATNVRKFNFEFTNVEGSQVKIVRPGRVSLSLAEVEVFGTVVTDAPTVSPAPSTSPPPTGTYGELENLALEGTATQVCTGFGGVPSRAINGNNSPYWSSRSISHTCRRAGAWWQVALAEEESLIEKIVVWNRLDCCSQRLQNSKVQVIDSDGTVVYTGTIGATYNIRSFEFVLDSPVIGATVKVTLDGTNYLQLSEVEVFGRNPQ